MTTLVGERTPPDRGLRYFLAHQNRWSSATLALGAVTLLTIVVGTFLVLNAFGWTQACPEGATASECATTEPLARGFTSEGLGRLILVTIALALVTAAAAVVSWTVYQNKPSKEATIAGFVLAAQGVLLAASLWWFRLSDVERFARNFLDVALLGDKAGFVVSSVTTDLWGVIRASLPELLVGAAIGVTGWLLQLANWAFAKVRHTRPEFPVRRIVILAAAGLAFGLLAEITARADLPSFARGAWNTLRLSLLGAALGFGLGLLISFFTMSQRAVIRAPARLYINFFRGTPLIWQISFAGIGLVPALRLDLDMYTIAILVLGFNLAAYSSEVYRAGIQSIERGQIEASRTLGLTYIQSLWYVIVPQAIRRVIPPLLNEFVILIKDTSLVSVLGLTIAQKELLGVGRDIYSSTFDATAWLGAAAGFLIITLPMIRVVTIVERRMRSGLTSVIGGG
jgi:polar amino acid transport system permease protein